MLSLKLSQSSLTCYNYKCYNYQSKERSSKTKDLEQLKMKKSFIHS